MSGQTLRGLSRDYAAGDLDRDTYRLKRRQLLEGISSGTEPLLKFQPPEPATPTVFPYDDDDGDTTQEILPVLGASSASGRGRLLTAVVVIAALAAGAAWFGLRDSGQAPAPGTPAEVAAPEVATEPNLLESFLASNVWNGDSITALETAWRDLDLDTRARLRDSDAMRDFSSALFRQYATESALLELGDTDQAFAAQSRLLDLGDRLELDDQRLTRARGDWLALAETRGAQDETAAPAVPAAPPLEADVATAGTADNTVDPVDNAAEPVAEPPVVSDQATAAEATVDAPATPVAAPPVPVPVAITPEPAPEPTPAPAPPAPAPVATKPAPEASAQPAAPAPPAANEAVGPSAGAASTGTKTNCKAELARTRRPYCIDVLASGEKGPVLVVLNPGTFEMGGREDHELPRRKVSIDYPLALGLFEISAAELKRYCAATGSTCPTQPWSDDELPAVNVSWNLAHAYTVWLSDITGFAYRLPSEAEWEYAARAGTTTTFPFGDELLPTHAHYSFTNPLDQPLKANDRSINRNEFRLYHMLGNVREWAQDNWADSYAGAPLDGSARLGTGDPRRVVRGGSYADHAGELRSGARQVLPAETADIHTGFRVVRAIDN